MGNFPVHKINRQEGDKIERDKQEIEDSPDCNLGVQIEIDLKKKGIGQEPHERSDIRHCVEHERIAALRQCTVRKPALRYNADGGENKEGHPDRQRQLYKNVGNQGDAGMRDNFRQRPAGKE